MSPDRTTGAKVTEKRDAVFGAHLLRPFAKFQSNPFSSFKMYVE